MRSVVYRFLVYTKAYETERANEVVFECWLQNKENNSIALDIYGQFFHFAIRFIAELIYILAKIKAGKL